MKTRRERLRQAAVDEIKSIAWEITSTQGADKVSVNGIARKMGMTPPAFYSYFKSRDELIKTLIIDSYKCFREFLIAARDNVPEEDSAGRLYHVCMAWREWAIENPNQFGLFAGRSVFGFDPPDDEVIQEANKGYHLLIELYNKAWLKGSMKSPNAGLNIQKNYLIQLKRSMDKWKFKVPPEVGNLIVSSSCLIHGMISLELSNRLNTFVEDPVAYYQFQILDLMKRVGIDYHPNDSR